MRTRLRTYGPIAVTILLLVLVVRKVGLGELADAIRGADRGLVLLALITGQLLSIPQALKGQILLRAQGHRVPLLALSKLYFVGLFFNNFLPGNVGGDFVRGYEVGRRIKDPATGMATIFVERLSGFVVLVFFAGVAFLTRLDLFQNPILGLAMGLASVGLIGLGWLALDPRLLGWIEGRVSYPAVLEVLSKFRKFQAALFRYRGQRRCLVLVFLLSIVFYAGAVAYGVIALAALQPPMIPVAIIFIVPVTMVVAMMPFTFNGVGLQEWSWVLLFPLVGVPAPLALSTMLLIRAITIVSSIVGGLCYLHLRAGRRDGLPTEPIPS